MHRIPTNNIHNNIELIIKLPMVITVSIYVWI